jgi:hypothetical protein
VHARQIPWETNIQANHNLVFPQFFFFVHATCSFAII